MDTTGRHQLRRTRRGRDRDHLFPGRRWRAAPSFTEDERAAIVAAAGRAGLTPTGYIALAAVAHARGDCTPTGATGRTGTGEPDGGQAEVMAQVLAELFDTRTALTRVGTNLNQAVAAFNATGTPPVWLGNAVRLVTRAVATVDATASAAGRRMR